ncbi:Multiple inositol polyphosphate phosphatase 1-like 2 [Homarus americanus]|uniref:Multiple inositol polyphosphate phosphatase 1 n=1 Tax=Homarus americanus TaxID=6706 RepID=A0A8J5JD23_HOMAM|nr:Multiple inositol polyphosphate phosphatase 1-like 2 [Homarus americanus]
MRRQTHTTFCCWVLVLWFLSAAAAAATVTVTAPQGQTEDLYCFTDDLTPYNKFSTKTAYSLARGEFTHDDLVPKGCEARQAWHLVRHGTRYPSEDDIAAFLLVLPDLQADVLGHRELESLSARYQEAIPNLLRQPFTNDSFKFRHTARQRTAESARAYANGLFGHDFYEVCDKYVTEVDDNPEADRENQLFQDGPEMTSVVASVSRRLGVGLEFGEVEVLYDACRFYKAWDPTAASPWCVAFTPDDLKVLEYWKDLHYYYIEGYGYNVDYEMACRPLQDLLQHFSAISPPLQVMARLGLYKDASPPSHDHIDPNRVWRTSEHGSFATNIAFTLSFCSQEDEWWVSAAVSEKVVVLGGCASPLGCTWEEFITTYGNLLQCDFDAICQNTDSGTPTSSGECCVVRDKLT